VYIDEFESWADAVRAADIDIRPRLISDLQSVRKEIHKPPEPADVDAHGQYTASRIKKYFGAWEKALKTANIDYPTEQELLTELRRVDSNVDGKLSQADMDDIGRYSSHFVGTVFESWADGIEAAELGEQETQPSPTDTDRRSPSELDQSALENSWETIPDSKRLDGQLLAKVKEIRTPSGDRKDAILSLVDRLGQKVKLDVWSTHELGLEWEQGEWYALENIRGTVWETNSGSVQKRLSTTSDFERIALGTEFDPADVDLEQQPTVETGPKTEPTASKSSTTEAESTTKEPANVSDDSTQNENGDGDKDGGEDQTQSQAQDEDEDEIFDEIMSDFENL
jgi:hypothetical protein